MDAHERLVSRVGQEQDDVLCTIQLVRGDETLERRLFDQLVDLLVESMFLQLRHEFVNGTLDRHTYTEKLGALAEQCRAVGLLPLPSRDG